LKGWKFDPWDEPFADSEAGLSFWKPEWDYDYYVSLELLDHGHLVRFGLGRDEHETRINKRPRSDRLLAAVQKPYPDARSRAWWEAYIRMPPPADDWEKPEVLWRMQDEKGDFLKEVAERLLKVAAVSASFVDELVAKK